MTVLVTRLREGLRTSLLVVPALFVLTAVGLSFASVQLDAEGLTGWLDAVLPVGTASTTIELLATIAGSTITLTALVFSITMLVLQLSANQFSPRVLRTFLSDRTAQVTLGVLTGTFVYALLALRALDEPRADEMSLTAGLAVVLALASVAVFVNYINHISHKIRATSVMKAITDETVGAVHALPQRSNVAAPVPASPAKVVVVAPRRGFIVSVDVEQLVELAARQDAMLVFTRRVGDFVTTGSRLAEVYGAKVDPAAISRRVGISTERTTTQDPAFGLRQLVDIIEKAMSPAVNDTTTAVDGTGHVREILRVLAPVALHNGVHADDSGSTRLVLPTDSWEDYLALGVDEVLEVAGGSRRIRQSSEATLLELLTVASPSRKPAVRRRLDALRQTADDVQRRFRSALR